MGAPSYYPVSATSPPGLMAAADWSKLNAVQTAGAVFRANATTGLPEWVANPFAQTTDVTTALATKANTTHTHTASQISDSTAAGRALLIASTVAAQIAALGLGTAALVNSTAFEAAGAAASAQTAAQTYASNGSNITSGTVAAARVADLSATYLTLAGNLAGLGNQTTARGNLGLGTVATLNSGTASGNVPTLGTGGSLTLTGGLVLPTGTTAASGITQNDVSLYRLAANTWAVGNGSSGFGQIKVSGVTFSGSGSIDQYCNVAANNCDVGGQLRLVTALLSSAGHLTWSTTTSVYGPPDAGIKHDALAGTMAVSNGTTGYGSLKALNGTLTGTLAVTAAATFASTVTASGAVATPAVNVNGLTGTGRVNIGYDNSDYASVGLIIKQTNASTGVDTNSGAPAIRIVNSAGTTTATVTPSGDIAALSVGTTAGTLLSDDGNPNKYQGLNLAAGYEIGWTSTSSYYGTKYTRINCQAPGVVGLIGAMFMANSASAPSTIAGGGILYTESGALKFKGSAGNVTTLAAA